jgi:YwiC-like protein
MEYVSTSGGMETFRVRQLSPAAPKEHGAYLILLVPYLAGIGAAGWSITGIGAFRLLLLLNVCMCGFVGTKHVELLLRRRLPLFSPGAHNVLPVLTLLSGAMLLIADHQRALVLLSLAACAMVIIRLASQLRATKGRPDRTLGGEIFAAATLTLSGPAAQIAVSGHLTPAGIWLWGLSFAYFSCGIVYVKMWLRAAASKRNWNSAVRYECGRLNLACAAVLVACALLPLWIRGSMMGGGWSAGAFVPALLRSVMGYLVLKPTLPNLKRVGMLEAALCAGYLIAVVPMLRRLWPT